MKPNGKKQKKGRGFSLLPSRQKSLFLFDSFQSQSRYFLNHLLGRFQIWQDIVLCQSVCVIIVSCETHREEVVVQYYTARLIVCPLCFLQTELNDSFPFFCVQAHRVTPSFITFL